MVQAYKKITEKRLKWYGHVRRMKEEAHSEKNARCGHTPERRRGRPNLIWKYACKRDMENKLYTFIHY